MRMHYEDALGLKERTVENPGEQSPREKPGLVLQANSRRENHTAHAVLSGQLLTPSWILLTHSRQGSGWGALAPASQSGRRWQGGGFLSWADQDGQEPPCVGRTDWRPGCITSRNK